MQVWRRKKKLKASMSCRQQCGSPRIGEGSTTTAATTATAATTQSVSTISMLLLKPPAIMAGISDVQMDETRFARLKNRWERNPIGSSYFFFNNDSKG